MGDDDFTIREHPPIPAGQALPVALYGTADPGFFSALQIPLVAGRFFTTQDRAGHPDTVIVSAQLARQYFPGENPLGKHLHAGAIGDADYEIVGVVGDTLYQVGVPAEATMYLPVLRGNALGITLVVRTVSDPLAFSIPVQKQIASLDPEMPVRDVFTLQQIIERSLGNASLSARLVLAFAVLSIRTLAKLLASKNSMPGCSTDLFFRAGCGCRWFARRTSSGIGAARNEPIASLSPSDGLLKASPENLPQPD